MYKKELLEGLKPNPKANFIKLYTKEYINCILWEYVPFKLIRKYKDLIDWYDIPYSRQLSEAFIEKHKDFVIWTFISIYQHLSEAFIERHKYLVDWDNISEFQHLSEDFIKRHKYFVNWDCISKYQSLSESFIEKYKDFVNWDLISTSQLLSEAFIKKNKDLVNWACISAYQKLSEAFIEKYKGLVNWDNISKYQPLSEAFIKKHKDLVNWDYILEYQSLSDTFIEAHKNKLNISLVNDNWLNKETSFKKKAVIDTGLYECYEDYFIAYKGIRSDRYSKFNFQYQYLPGNTYTCFADGSEDENSFGLSVWNEVNAKNYCSELVVKCKVFYEDVARVVHNGGKIRCSKITILD